MRSIHMRPNNRLNKLVETLVPQAIQRRHQQILKLEANSDALTLETTRTTNRMQSITTNNDSMVLAAGQQRYQTSTFSNKTPSE